MAANVPVKIEKSSSAPSAVQSWRPFQSLRQEIDRAFEDFDRGFWRFPFGGSFFDVKPSWGRELTAGAPAVDVAEKENAYEITAELAGMDEKNIEVKLVNGGLTIKGEKTEEKEEKDKDYHVQERRFGSFERYFTLPEGVEANKIEATFKNGVLRVTVPKKPEAIQPEKKIQIKAA